jgi:lipopolysaccharide export system protein LptA
MRIPIVLTFWWGRALGIGLLVGVVAAGSAPAVHGQVPADTAEADRTDERAVVNADSLSALVRDGVRLQELFGNVKVRQDTTRLRSKYALRYLNRDEFLFTGDVVIYERGDTLRADTVRYNKRTKVGRAWSNVRLTDGEVVVRAPRATYYTQEKRSVFPDSVTLIDSTRVLRAQSGTYWSDARRAEFQGHVRLDDPETHLAADSLTYYRDQERSIATGEVFIRRVGTDAEAPTDTTARTYLFGKWVDNQEQARYSHVRGRALLVRVRLDSTGTPQDTLLVRGRRLEAYRADTHRRLIAVDSVRIWERDLAAVADSAVYDRVVATGPLDSLGTPRPIPGPSAPSLPPSVQGQVRSTTDTTGRSPPDTTQNASPDTARTPPAARPDTSARPSPDAQADAEGDSTAGADSTEPASPPRQQMWQTPVAQADSALPLEETRLFQKPVTWFERSQVWGDSIRVRATGRRIDTVFVRRRAFAAQRDSVLDRIQQLKGRHLTADFADNALRRLTAGPNALAIRFLKTGEGTLKGAARVSGDRIVLRFHEGEVRRTSVLGGVESTYYRTPEAVPDPFRLDGFRWTPGRRPTKDRLLRPGRVRDQLAAPPPSRPLAQRLDPAAADSLRERSAPPARSTRDTSTTRSPRP